MDDVKMVRDGDVDGVVAREVSRAGSDTQRALDGWALTRGGMGGGGGTAVVGETPLRFTPDADGNGTLEALTSSATLTPSADGTYVTLSLIGGA